MTGEEKGWTIVGVATALAVIVVAICIAIGATRGSNNEARTNVARARACSVHHDNAERVGLCIQLAGRR